MGTLQVGYRERVYKLTTQCFKDLGGDVVPQQKELGEKIPEAAPFCWKNSTCRDMVSNLAESLSQQGYEEKKQSTRRKLIDYFPACH